MSIGATQPVDDHIDDRVDVEIAQCLRLEKPRSFFLFAGAGSGKTSSLITAINGIRDRYGKELKLGGQRVGVITYTNNARDEIKERALFDYLVEVSTIHSFVWSLIKGFDRDIAKWIGTNLQTEIAELHAQQAKARHGTKAYADMERSIASKTRRLGDLRTIRHFTYNPNGETPGRDSLNHAEVIKLGAHFIESNKIMQRILTNRFPFLLVDESQDTNKPLMEALLKLQAQYEGTFAIGLFGDTMQRIYADGKIDLGRGLPSTWATPAKRMNHRCPKRIVALLNNIRAEVDNHVQQARSDKPDGTLRIFILPNNVVDKTAAERQIAEQMTAITQDSAWTGPGQNVKTLILEHHMAARRMGFLSMYEPLYSEQSLRTGLLEGTLSGIRFFSESAYPIIRACQKGDQFEIARIARDRSPLLSKTALRQAQDQPAQIKKANEAVKALLALFSNAKEPTFLDVLLSIYHTGLFQIPETLKLIASRTPQERQLPPADEPLPPGDSALQTFSAWDTFLGTPFSQIEQYVSYIKGDASFETHQGVKGLEFERVMVIMDDSEARGFMFSYDKLFGVREKTRSDLDNERDGKETSNDRTSRLFYVTCSRAEKSLAIVAYSENPTKLAQHIASNGWFQAGEIVLLK